MKNILLSFSLLISLAAVFLPAGASAASLFSGAKDEACIAVNADSRGKCDDAILKKQGSDKAGSLIRNVLDILTIIIGIIAVIMIIISGFRFVTSGGDSNSVSSARNTLIYALVGLIIVAFAQLLVKFVLVRVSG